MRDQPLDPPYARPEAVSRDQLAPGWGAFVDAITDEQRVVVSALGGVDDDDDDDDEVDGIDEGMSLGIAIAGSVAVHRFVELLRGIHDDVGDDHGGVEIEAELDPRQTEDSRNAGDRFSEWAFLDVSFGDGWGATPSGPLLRAMTKSAKARNKLGRRMAHRVAVEHLGAPPPRSVPMRDVPVKLRPLVAALLRERIAVTEASCDRGNAELLLATNEVTTLRWLCDACLRVNRSLKGKMLASAGLLWERPDRWIGERCFGWHGVQVDLFVWHRSGLTEVLIAEAAQAVLADEPLVRFR